MANWHLRLIAKAMQMYVIAQGIDCKTDVKKFTIIGASVSEPHLGSSTRPLSVCLSVYIYIYIYITRSL